jgi:zinc D-Ala-D-Ala dipeptidase
VTSGVNRPPCPSIWHGSTPNGHILQPPIVECDEPLIDLRAIKPICLDSHLANTAGTFSYLRITVADRLVTAQTLIPRGLRLLIIAGYLPPTTHTASPAYQAHLTGGAVDLTLCADNGRKLDLTATTVPTHPATSDQADTQYRNILRNALTITGFVNYPTMWWHWSYGDRYWAYATQTPTAPYGPLTSLNI